MPASAPSRGVLVWMMGPVSGYYLARRTTGAHARPTTLPGRQPDFQKWLTAKFA